MDGKQRKTRVDRIQITSKNIDQFMSDLDARLQELNLTMKPSVTKHDFDPRNYGAEPIYFMTG